MVEIARSKQLCAIAKSLGNQIDTGGETNHIATISLPVCLHRLLASYGLIGVFLRTAGPRARRLEPLRPKDVPCSLC